MRLFVAVWPPEEVVDILYNLPHPERKGVRWIQKENLHTTLVFLGETSSLDEARDALLALALDAVTPATATLGPTTALLGTNVLQVPVQGLDKLAKVANSAPWPSHSGDTDRTFHGHITLARTRERHTISSLAGIPVHASWKVSMLHLVVSELRPHGPQYEKLYTRQLAV
ncbi:MAG: RNA 2',3'-cyclic phosphodiesterase [Acidimicrobiales bacterium]